MQAPSRWNVAIFAARETSDTLVACIRAALEACKANASTIDVLVNGNRALAQDVANLMSASTLEVYGNELRLWFIPMGDKAHAWNEYLHSISQAGQYTFFVDGYAVVRPDALSRIAAGIADTPNALAATGAPWSGRAADSLNKGMRNGGGIQGALYAIRGSTMATLRKTGFRFPKGLYRSDGFIGAVLMFNLDPSCNQWDPGRIHIQFDATWDIEKAPWWHPRGIHDQWKRKLRQAQGYLENRAARNHMAVNRLAPWNLPATIAEFVTQWVSDHPTEARHLFMTKPLALHALRKMKQPKDWSLADAGPELLMANHVTDAAASVR